MDNAWATVQVHAYLDARRVPRRGAEGPRIVVKMKSRVDLEIQKKFQAKKASHLPKTTTSYLVAFLNGEAAPQPRNGCLVHASRQLSGS